MQKEEEMLTNPEYNVAKTRLEELDEKSKSLHGLNLCIDEKNVQLEAISSEIKEELERAHNTLISS